MKTGITVATALALSLVFVSLCGAQAETRTKATEISGDISSTMTDMAGMMGKMAAMTKDMTPDRRKALAEIMKEVASEMTNVANILAGGIMSSDRALELVHVRLMRVQQRIAALEVK